MPDNNTPRIKLRQRRSKAAVQVGDNPFDVHVIPHSDVILAHTDGACCQGTSQNCSSLDLRQYVLKDRVVVLYPVVEVDGEPLVGKVVDFFLVCEEFLFPIYDGCQFLPCAHA